MTKPRLLDLYCREGGAAVGYAAAGFEVIGVDIERQPRYPYEFIQADALDLLRNKAFMSQFHATHGSPPCERYTAGAGQNRTRDQHPDLIAPTRDLLLEWGGAYIIENVRGARRDLRNPITLCGQDFGLGVFRHRDFEVPWWSQMLHPHRPHEGRVGDGRFVTVTGHPGGRSNRDNIKHGSKADWERAMGITWMTANGLSKSIPPAYTKYIGEHLLAHLGVTA